MKPLKGLCGSILHGMLPFSFALVVVAAQAEKKAPAPVAKVLLAPTRLWLESFNFFAQEQDDEAIQKLIQATVSDPTDNPDIMNRVFEFYLISKNRVNLTKYAVSMDRALGCEPTDARVICQKLGSLWRSNLDSVLFYETSAGALLKVKNALTAKDCASAATQLREVQGKEGEARPVLELLLDVNTCMGDTAAAAAIRQKLDEIENIGARPNS